YRRELVARNTKFRNRNDWLKALDMVAEMSGWGKPLPEGWARGIAIDDRRRAQPTRTATALCAQVATVSVSRSGQVPLEPVAVGFRPGFPVGNPRGGAKEVEGQIAFAPSDALWQQTPIKDGRRVEGNFDTYQVARMADYPPQINIKFLKTDNKWISGVGEEAV